MIRFRNVVEIARPVEAVYAFLLDHRNVPAWNYWVRTVTALDAGPVGVGTRFHQVRRDDQQIFAITAAEPPRSITIETLPGERPAFRRTMTLEPSPSGTRLIDEWELETGHPRVLAPTLTAVARRGVGENLDKLRELLESGHTVLPDGRRSVLTAAV